MPPEASMDLDDEGVQAAAAAWRASQTKYDALRLVEGGRVVLVHLFREDRDGAAGAGIPSLRKLARAVGKAPGRLSVALRATLLYDKLPSEWRDRLSSSHYEVLVAAPELEQERWAREAALGGLGVRLLRELISGVKLPPAKHQDKTPIAMARRSVAPLRDHADAVAGHPKAAADFVTGLDALIAELQEIRGRALVPNEGSNRAGRAA
jgi:hypothetical protein